MFLLILCSVITKPAISQNEEKPQSLFGVNCVVPAKVETESEFTILFEIDKDAGYVGPLTIVQNLPRGLNLITEDLQYAEISNDGQQFEVFWRNVPLGNIFSFELKIGIGNISPAVYPFNGIAHFYGFSIGYSKAIMITSTAKNVGVEREGQLAPVHIDFEVPEKISAGREFTFVTIINKEANYICPGKIVQSWPKVFQPRPGSLHNAEFMIINNSVEISWGKLEQGEYFPIAYQVFVKETAQGVYPVISNFTDENGLKLIENKGIFVVPQEPDESEPPTAKKEEIHSIRLEHPTETIHGGDFDLSVFIQKGENTGPGSVHLMLPLGCEVDLVEGENLSYDQVDNEPIVSWDHMPASRVLEVEVVINTNHISKAAYLITASFITDEKVVATSKSHILISDENQLIALKKEELEATMTEMVDTTEMFSKLDKLLSEWQESTGGIQKEEPSQKNLTGEEYRIQIFASKTALPNIKKLLLSMNINETYNEHYDGEYYRYNVGEFKTRDGCTEYLEYLHDKGFSDAFIKRYVDGEPVRE